MPLIYLEGLEYPDWYQLEPKWYDSYDMRAGDVFCRHGQSESHEVHNPGGYYWDVVSGWHDCPVTEAHKQSAKISYWIPYDMAIHRGLVKGLQKPRRLPLNEFHSSPLPLP